MSPRGRKRGDRPQRHRRRQSGNRRPATTTTAVGFWGDASELPPTRQDIRMTEDPGAVPRSLGPPPLPSHEAIAEHYFEAVYDRAVTLAGALAAAAGLIRPEDLEDRVE